MPSSDERGPLTTGAQPKLSKPPSAEPQLGLGTSTRKNFGLALYVDFAATPANRTTYRDGVL